MVVLLVGSIIAFVPLPSSMVVEGVVWLPEHAHVRAASDGKVDTVWVRSGQRVDAVGAGALRGFVGLALVGWLMVLDHRRAREVALAGDVGTLAPGEPPTDGPATEATVDSEPEPLSKSSSSA